MWAPIRVFWQMLVGAAAVAPGSKFVVVAIPQSGATEGLCCLGSFHLMGLERLEELSSRYLYGGFLIALSSTHCEGCVPIPTRLIAGGSPRK